MKPLLLIVAFSYLLITNLYGQEGTIANPVLTWADEFDGTGAPNPTKWDRPEYNRRNNANGPDGFWSKEDSYLDGNGNLIIRVRKIDNKNDDTDAFDYSVGALRTKGKFEQLYGKYEIRCQLPTQPGWWVAFWMMQGNVGRVGDGGIDGSEVDIMEGFGWTGKINNAIHYDGYGADHKSKEYNKVYPDVREGFHTYSMEWTPEMYLFFIDGKEVWRTTGGGVCTHAGYVKVTGEISTEDWAITQWWANNPATATYPDSFVVDYVRVYNIGNFTDTTTNVKVQPLDDLKLYPNPVNESLFVNWPSRVENELLATISIVNAMGQVKKSFQKVENNSSLLVDDLERGVYLLKIEQNGKQTNHRFIKE